jgi:flagellar assembly protein FliH
MERLSLASQVLSLADALSPVEPKAEAMLAAMTAPMQEPDPRELLAQERQRTLASAQEEGYATGMAQAKDELRKAIAQAEEDVRKAHAAEGERLTAANERMTTLLRSVQRAVDESDDRLESLAVEVAFAALARVLGQAAADRALMLSVCRQALDEYRQRPVVLRVAVDEAEQVQALMHGEDIRIVADPHLDHGQCRLETHKGLYDTSVETRLDAVKQALLDALSKGGRDA